MTDTFIFLAQTAEPASDMSPLQSFMASPLPMIMAMFILFYFMLIRPQQQQRKQLKERIANLRKGDKVITTGGMHGVVNHKGDSTISLKVSEGNFITFDSHSIATVVTGGKEEKVPEEAPQEDKK